MKITQGFEKPVVVETVDQKQRHLLADYKIHLPAVRRCFPELLASEIVEVQPMANLPSSHPFLVQWLELADLKQEPKFTTDVNNWNKNKQVMSVTEFHLQGMLDPSSSIRLSRTEVESERKRLKAKWSIETVEELKSINIDAEEELSKALTEAINKELEKEQNPNHSHQYNSIYDKAMEKISADLDNTVKAEAMPDRWTPKEKITSPGISVREVDMSHLNETEDEEKIGMFFGEPIKLR